MSAIAFEAWRYTGGGVQSLPSTSAATGGALPLGDDGKTAKFVAAYVPTSSGAVTFGTVYLSFSTSSTTTPGSTAAVTDVPIQAGSGPNVFNVTGAKFYSCIGEQPSMKLNIVPIEF